MAEMDFNRSQRPAPPHSFDVDRWEDALALLKTAHLALEAVEHEPAIGPPLRTLSVALRMLDELIPET